MTALIDLEASTTSACHPISYLYSTQGSVPFGTSCPLPEKFFPYILMWPSPLLQAFAFFGLQQSSYQCLFHGVPPFLLTLTCFLCLSESLGKWHIFLAYQIHACLSWGGGKDFHSLWILYHLDIAWHTTGTQYLFVDWQKEWVNESIIVQMCSIFCFSVLCELDIIEMFPQAAYFFFCLIIDFNSHSMTEHKETHHSLLMTAIGFCGIAIIKCVQPVFNWWSWHFFSLSCFNDAGTSLRQDISLE